MTETFSRKVYNTVKKIPEGRVSTYALIAKAIGNPGAARAVGNAMKKNERSFLKSGKNRVPCHRVVKSDGTLGGFSGGVQQKIKLLKNEGVDVYRGKVVKFSKIVY